MTHTLPKNKTKVKSDPPVTITSLRDADPYVVRELAVLAFLTKLSHVRNLSRLKLKTTFGLVNSDIEDLVQRGYLLYKEDNTSGICYYNVNIPILK